ncbi:MAG: hypothetical protein V1740_04525 [Candidatus Woesearchaeota archaeon]
MTSPELVDSGDIAQMLELSNSVTIKEIIEPIKRAMGLFEQNISTMAFLPDVSKTVVRIATFQSLLNQFREEIKGSRYDEILEEAGEVTGKTFAEDLFRFLLKHNKLPKDERVLLNLWIEFDTLAGWGNFRLEKSDNNYVIEVRNSFLTRELHEEAHKHCSFMKGYVKGFLSSALKEYYRLFKKMVVQPSSNPETIDKISVSCEKESCKFIVHIRKEAFVDAFDNLYDAKFCNRDGKINESAQNLRTSIESAFKQRQGLSKEDKTSLLKILDEMKEKGINLPYKKIGDIYASTSSIIHGSTSASNEKIKAMVDKWEQILEMVELMDMD